MVKEKIERKIAVIFATDIVGYSKHMEIDESETIHNLRQCEAILTGFFERHDGRLFNTGGDSFLAEFSSAVSAVECAVDFQHAIKLRNASDEATVKLEFRIGINSGDVVKEKDNLLGDGVNIAARLEALAQTNGITISKVIYDYVKGKTKYEFNDLGLQKIKQNEFYAYDLLLDQSQKRKLVKKKFSKATFALACVCILTFAGLYFYMYKSDPDQLATDSPEGQISTSSLPTVLVFPVSMMSDSTSTNAFGPAITESMISSLSKFVGISIMSSSTSFHAEKKEYSDEDIRENYQADYVIRGSIQTFGDASRINITLADLIDQKIVWSDKIDFDISEIFKVQDQISNNLLTHLQIDAVTGTNVRSWAAELGSLERLTRFLNSRDEWRKFNPEGYKNSVAITDDLALELGEDNPIIKRQRAYNLFLKLRMNLSEDREKDKERLKEILELVNQPQNIGSTDALSLRGISELVFYSKDCEIARSFTRKSIEANASVDAYTTAGTADFLCKDYPSSIQNFENALRLVPNDNGWFITRYLGATLYNADRTDRILELLKSNIDSSDMPANLLAYYAYSVLKDGDKIRAKKYFNLAKSKGLSKKYLTRYDMSREVFEDFKNKMKEIGTIE